MWYHLRLLEQCNLGCSHCYAKNRSRSVKISKSIIVNISEQIKNIQNRADDFTAVYLSGGEPFLHPEFLKILDFLYYQDHIDKINVLTNGLLVNKWLKNLCKYREKIGVQISIDGDEKVNDKIRGQGVYKRASKALFSLKDAEIPHWISFTVSKENFHCYKKILDLALTTQSINNNITPYTGNITKMLSYREWKEFKYLVLKYAVEIGLTNPCGPNVCGFSYQCGAFVAGVTVNPDGTITGCARDNRSCGHYDQLDSILTDKKRMINKTCMRSKWGQIEYFSLKTMLE